MTNASQVFTLSLSSTLLLIGQKTCQTSLLGKSIFSQVFVGVLKHLLEKQEMEWQIIIGKLMMVISYVKRTAGRKTEQSKLWWKDENSSTNSRSFKELLINKRLETSSSPGYKLTSKKRMSFVYHVEFPHFLQELKVKTV